MSEDLESKITKLLLDLISQQVKKEDLNELKASSESARKEIVDAIHEARKEILAAIRDAKVEIVQEIRKEASEIRAMVMNTRNDILSELDKDTQEIRKEISAVGVNTAEAVEGLRATIENFTASVRSAVRKATLASLLALLSSLVIIAMLVHRLYLSPIR